MFSICLCSWNDLEYLKILYGSVKKNTKVAFEFVVHDNGSEDGTEKWLKEHNIKYTKSKENEGVAAVNYCVQNAKYDYIININADMYVLPGWDTSIIKQVQQFKKVNIKKYTISSCLIEPVGDNQEYTISYHGHNYESFNENSLMSYYLRNYKTDTKENTVQYSHPISMPKDMWNEIGGIDTQYFPGYASDHDLAAKAYNVGCRNFCMLGNSRVYHFISQTLSKLPKELRNKNGHDLFFRKWGLTVEDFRDKIGVKSKFEVLYDK